MRGDGSRPPDPPGALRNVHLTTAGRAQAENLPSSADFIAMSGARVHLHPTGTLDQRRSLIGLVRVSTKQAEQPAPAGRCHLRGARRPPRSGWCSGAPRGSPLPAMRSSPPCLHENFLGNGEAVELLRDYPVPSDARMRCWPIRGQRPWHVQVICAYPCSILPELTPISQLPIQLPDGNQPRLGASDPGGVRTPPESTASNTA